MARPRPPPRPPPRWPGGVPPGGICASMAPTGAARRPINAKRKRETRIVGLLERRGLPFAPDVVAHAERLDGIQILTGMNRVRSALPRLIDGDVHRVFAVV